MAERFGHQYLVDLVETGAHPPDRRVAQPVGGFQRDETAVPVVLDLPVVPAGGAAGGESLQPGRVIGRLLALLVQGYGDVERPSGVLDVPVLQAAGGGLVGAAAEREPDLRAAVGQARVPAGFVEAEALGARPVHDVVRRGGCAAGLVGEQVQVGEVGVECTGELAPLCLLGTGVPAEHEVAAGLAGEKLQYAGTAGAAGGGLGEEPADPAFGTVLHGDVGAVRVGAGPDALDVPEEEVGPELREFGVLC